MKYEENNLDMYELDGDTMNLLINMGFHLMIIHTDIDTKGFVIANQREYISGTPFKKLILLSTQYLNDSLLTKKELNDTIKNTINNYVDSEEYKNKKDYHMRIKKDKHS